MKERPMSDYTPTTEDILRHFSAPAYKVNPQREGESFSAYLGRASMESFESQIASEAAFRRWLAEHDRQVKAAALREFADSLGVNAGDEDSDYWQGYRNGQRQALRKTRDEIERIEKEQTND